MSDCMECGMCLENDGEYHPYAACLMFKGCRDGATVRANLNGVVAHGAQYDSGFDNMADRIAQLEAAINAALAEDHGNAEVYAELVPKILVRALQSETKGDVHE
jgi:hypothetical protein